MRIDHLRYLVEVAECGSMSKAAKNLFVTQPAISNAITALEKEIGWPVLERDASGVRATTKGKLVIDDARQIVNIVHSWSDELDAVNLDKITGDVYIADSGELGLSFFQETIMELNRVYPKLTIHAVPLQSHPLKEINNGRFELTLLPVVPGHHRTIERYLRHYRWSMEPLYRDNCCLLLSPENPLAEDASLSVGMLDGFSIVSYPDFPYRNFLESRIPGCVVQSEDPLRCVTLAANNDAVVIFPPSQDVLLDSYLEDGIIKKQWLTDVELPLEINVIYSDSLARTDAGKLIIKTLKERFQDRALVPGNTST